MRVRELLRVMSFPYLHFDVSKFGTLPGNAQRGTAEAADDMYRASNAMQLHRI